MRCGMAPGVPETEKMNRCLWFVTVALALASCASPRVGTEPYGELKQKCDAGSDTACHDYAFFTYDSNPRESELSYRLLCEKQLARACSNLAHRLAERATPDFKQARVLYDRGCEPGDGVACHHLANLYILAQGVEKDDQRALFLLQKSCDMRYAQACFRVSVIIQRGKLTAPNPSRAFEYMEGGCMLNASISCHDLGYMVLEGRGTTMAADRAADLFRLSCDRGLPRVCGSLAYLYQTGTGVAQNHEKHEG